VDKLTEENSFISAKMLELNETINFLVTLVPQNSLKLLIVILSFGIFFNINGKNEPTFNPTTKIATEKLNIVLQKHKFEEFSCTTEDCLKKNDQIPISSRSKIFNQKVNSTDTNFVKNLFLKSNKNQKVKV